MSIESASTIRARVAEGMVEHAPFDGWTRAAFDAAVADSGIDPVLARNALPGGPADALAAVAAHGDAALLDALANPTPDEGPADALARAIRVRLEHNAGREEAVRQGTAFLAAPANAPLATRLLHRTADAIRTAAGDCAPGPRGAARRAAVASVHAATLLVWLNDDSEGRADTWAFLERRLTAVIGAGTAAERGAGRLGAALAGFGRDAAAPLRRMRAGA